MRETGQPLARLTWAKPSALHWATNREGHEIDTLIVAENALTISCHPLSKREMWQDFAIENLNRDLMLELCYKYGFLNRLNDDLNLFFGKFQAVSLREIYLKCKTFYCISKILFTIKVLKREVYEENPHLDVSAKDDILTKEIQKIFKNTFLPYDVIQEDHQILIDFVNQALIEHQNRILPQNEYYYDDNYKTVVETIDGDLEIEFFREDLFEEEREVQRSIEELSPEDLVHILANHNWTFNMLQDTTIKFINRKLRGASVQIAQTESGSFCPVIELINLEQAIWFQMAQDFAGASVIWQCPYCNRFLIYNSKKRRSSCGGTCRQRRHSRGEATPRAKYENQPSKGVTTVAQPDTNVASQIATTSSRRKRK